MTEERIKELQELVHRRECLRNEIEALQNVLKMEQDALGYSIQDTRVKQEYSYIHFIKDHFGYLNEAISKMCARYRQELAEVQKAIENY